MPSPKLTYYQLTSKVAKRSNLSPETVRQVHEATWGTIQDTVAQDGEVYLAGFGKFYLATRAAGLRNNPQVPGQQVAKPLSARIAFKTFPKLRTKLSAFRQRVSAAAAAAAAAE